MVEPPANGAQEMVKTSFSLPKALRRELKIVAAKEDRDMSKVVAEALEAYLAKTRTTDTKAR